MSILVKQGDVVEVTVYYKETPKGNIVAKSSKEFETIHDEKKGEYKKLTCTCKRLSWKMQNDLQRNATKEGADKWDWIGFRENKLAAILAKWDAIDEEGLAIKIEPKTISSLHPQIANSILDGYDEVSYLGEDEQKNS